MKLTHEESEILSDFEEGRLFPSVTDKTVLQKFTDAANRIHKKTKNVSIELTEDDFGCIMSESLRKGIPYQALISSIIRNYIAMNSLKQLGIAVE